MEFRIASLLLLLVVASPGSVESFLGSNRRCSQEQHKHDDKMCLKSQAKDDNGEDYQVLTKNPLRLAVLRLGMTELRFTSLLNYRKPDGIIKCAYCGKELFDSSAAYDSGSGWPSFWRSKDETSIDYKPERGNVSEVRCGRCKSHLGHVFLDGPKPSQVEQSLIDSSPSTDPRMQNQNSRYPYRLPRYCINGAAITVAERESES